MQRCAEGDELARRLYRWPERAATAGQRRPPAARRLRRADAALRQAEALLEATTWARWRWHITLLRARAELALATERPEEAWAFATQSLELATRSDSRKHIAHARITLGTIAAAQERWPDAAQLLRGGVTQAEHIGAARELWLVPRLAGVLMHLGREREPRATDRSRRRRSKPSPPTERLAAARRLLAADPVRDVYRMLGKRPPPEPPSRRESAG